MKCCTATECWCGAAEAGEECKTVSHNGWCAYFHADHPGPCTTNPYPEKGATPVTARPEAEFVEITTFADVEPQYVEARCLHNERIPVESCVTGDVLAYICARCERQLGV